jgi:hypothetical protein
MTRKSWLLLVLIALLTGCMPVDSLNPWYTDKDLVFDEALLGDWKWSNDKGVLSFIEYVTDIKPHLYSIEMVEDNGSKTEYRAHLFEIQGHRFLDVVPETWEARSDSYALHVTATNQGAKVEPHLLRLGAAAYLEFSNATGSGDGVNLRAQLRPAHWLFHVKSDGKKMKLDSIDDDDLRKLIEPGKIHVGNAILGQGSNKNLVLTAETKELQRFVLEHVNDEAVFSMHGDEIQHQP